MDVPSQAMDLEGTVVVDAAWGRARFSPRHDCFVRVLAMPSPVALDAPGLRVLASSSTWVAVEDVVGVTAAALIAAVGVDRIDPALRRRVWEVAVSSPRVVPRTDQVTLGFDGQVAVLVPATLDPPHDDTDRALLALALDVDPASPAPDGRDDRALAALLAKTFPAEARAFEEARARARQSTTPPETAAAATTATPPAPSSSSSSPPSAPGAEGAAAALAGLTRLAIPRHGFIALPAVIDGDDDAAWRPWKEATERPPPPSAEELARLNAPARRRRIAAAFGHVLSALAARSPEAVSIGGPFDVLLFVDRCGFRDDERRRAAPATTTDDTRAPPFQCRYVSPEEAVGGTVDVRSSLYVLGVHFFEALCGRHPFWSDTSVGFAWQHVRKAPMAPTAVNPGVHAGLAGIAMRLLRKAPGERFQTPGEVQTALAAAVAGGPDA